MLYRKRAYEQRITEVEHASFTPIVLSASGGLAKGTTKELPQCSQRSAWDQPYSATIGWLISFSLLRSAVQCLSVHVRRREMQLDQYPS